MDQPAFPVIKGTLTKKGNCIILVKEATLIIEYINEALRLAKYEIIDDEEPYYENR